MRRLNVVCYVLAAALFGFVVGQMSSRPPLDAETITQLATTNVPAKTVGEDRWHVKMYGPDFAIWAIVLALFTVPMWTSALQRRFAGRRFGPFQIRA